MKAKELGMKDLPRLASKSAGTVPQPGRRRSFSRGLQATTNLA